MGIGEQYRQTCPYSISKINCYIIFLWERWKLDFHDTYHSFFLFFTTFSLFSQLICISFVKTYSPTLFLVQHQGGQRTSWTSFALRRWKEFTRGKMNDKGSQWRDSSVKASVISKLYSMAPRSSGWDVFGIVKFGGSGKLNPLHRKRENNKMGPRKPSPLPASHPWGNPRYVMEEG